MHRDIKPFNVLINPETKALKIIDFGLAEFYFPTQENNTHVASLYYKSPELFFSNSNYDYRVDVWSAGLIFAGMVILLFKFRSLVRLLSSTERTTSIKSSKSQNLSAQGKS